MLARSLDEIGKVLGGELLQGRGERTCCSISTDSRALRPGDLFVALRGERFDGHEYIRDAEAVGACGAVISESLESEKPSFPLIQVQDTLQALCRLASEERSRLSCPVIAITGSNGKSTTRALADRVLSAKYQVLAAEKSYNNQIGVSLTLLRNEPNVDCVVLELGTNHPGEIEALCRLCRPTVALITNIGKSHLEFFGDERGVLREKMALPKWPTVEHVFYNADDALLSEAIRGLDKERTSFGTVPHAQMRAESIELTPRWGTLVVLESGHRFELDLPGRHQGLNALAAVALGKWFGILEQTAAQRLDGSKGPPRRCEVKEAAGIRVVDDTYNSNPSSLGASLELLSRLPRQGRGILVMGQMAELGEKESAYHKEAGRFCGEKGLDYMAAVGEGPALAAGEAKARGVEVLCCESIDDCLEALFPLLRQGDAVLVKGSRAARMDELVDRLVGRLAGSQAYEG